MSALFNTEGKLMKSLTWLSNMVHVQLLWLAFTLLGVGIGGLFPATLSMFSIMRRLILEKDTFSINDAFWKEYKKNFIKNNLIGYTLFFVGLLVNYYLRSSLILQNQLSLIYTIMAIIFLFLFLAFITWFGPIYAHYDASVKQYSKFIFIFIFSFPFHTIGMFVTIFILYFSVFTFPILLPFVSIGIAVYLITFIAMHAVRKSEYKLKKN